MNTQIWKNMESSAWRDANIYEKLFLTFCLAFDYVSGETTSSEMNFEFNASGGKKSQKFFCLKEKL